MSYVRNDPVNLVDPDGMDPDDPGTWIFGGASNYMIWSDVGKDGDVPHVSLFFRARRAIVIQYGAGDF
jgi:hypothetical protein